ncbi:3305_t:CDS:1, partial [Entrophospora sp. SA101]
VNTTGLLQKVQAAIFLSLDELWSVPTELVQIATVLDPRFKNFQWDRSGEERDKSHQLLRELYDFTKVDFESNNIQQTTTIHNLHTTNEDDNDDFFETLEIDLSSFEVENDDDEVLSYVKLRQIDIMEDPLKWWDANKGNFPILSQLAQKYLSIPATS